MWRWVSLPCLLWVYYKQNTQPEQYRARNSMSYCELCIRPESVGFYICFSSVFGCPQHSNVKVKSCKMKMSVFKRRAPPIRGALQQSHCCVAEKQSKWGTISGECKRGWQRQATGFKAISLLKILLWSILSSPLKGWPSYIKHPF